MSNKYLLVNPFLHGDIKPIFKAKTSIEAANEAYKSISQYFGNNNPEFIFTLQKIKGKDDIGNGNNSDFSHFKISEKRSDNNNKAIKFSLQELHFNSSDNKNMKNFKNNLKNTIISIKEKSKIKHTKKGGGKYDDDFFDDDDDLFDDDDILDDDDMFLYDIYEYPRYRKLSNLYGYYYNPLIYKRFFKTFFHLPTFIPGVAPYFFITLK